MTRELTLRVDGKEIVVRVHREGERIVVEHGGERHEILVTSDRPEGVLRGSTDEARSAAGSHRTTTPAGANSPPAGNTPVLAPMVGVVRELHVAFGAEVSEGDKLITMEAMKMDIFVLAETSGVIDSLSCSVGQTVQEGQTIARIAPAAGDAGAGS